MDFNIELLDDSLNEMVSRIELEGECCGLKHSNKDPAENHQAIDYLCQRLGNQKNSDDIHQELRVPICSECIEALTDTNWILIYCTYCHKSQWICRRLAKKEYPKGNLIYWLDVCPFCAEIADTYTGDEKNESQ
jgi:hypothetical protein